MDLEKIAAKSVHDKGLLFCARGHRPINSQEGQVLAGAKHARGQPMFCAVWNTPDGQVSQFSVHTEHLSATGRSNLRHASAVAPISANADPALHYCYGFSYRYVRMVCCRRCGVPATLCLCSVAAATCWPLECRTEVRTCALLTWCDGLHCKFWMSIELQSGIDCRHCLHFCPARRSSGCTGLELHCKSKV